VPGARPEPHPAAANAQQQPQNAAHKTSVKNSADQKHTFNAAFFNSLLVLLSHKVTGLWGGDSLILGRFIQQRRAGMDLRAGGSESRFSAYVEGLVSVIGHADRAGPLRDYCLGLMMPCERKSVEPMAAVTAPERTAAQHQALLHFVGEGGWSDERVLSKVQEMVLPAIERHGPIEAWIIDDTGFPKKGTHSVGVARQYCGQLGKQDNCQIAVSLSVANHEASLPVAYRLYLPQDWASDAVRRKKAKVPEGVSFKTKPEIALEQIKTACDAGVPRGVALMDAGYGANTALREGITVLGLSYVAGILPNTTVWASGSGPLRPKAWSGQGRPPKLLRRSARHRPVQVKDLALSLPAKAWRTIKWREGSADWLSSRFARIRVRPAHRDYKLTAARPEEWLLIEWPKGEQEPTKYWLSTLPEDITFARLVDLTKLRWRIERDYQELKQEVGLDHFEGRGWRGFHHHASLCIAAYGFLISERETIPPSAARATALIQAPSLPEGFRPRGSATQDRASHSALHRDHAPKIGHGHRAVPLALSLLCADDQTRPEIAEFMTQ
jgi:SRSO17 transposase